MNRVVITGMGIVSPLGVSVSEFWKALSRCQSGIGPITLIEEIDDLSLKVAAEVKNFTPEKYFSPDKLSRINRFTQFAIVAARQAFAQSGLASTEEVLWNTAAIIGSGAGGVDSLDDLGKDIYRRKKRRAAFLTIPRYIASSCAGQVSMDLGTTGPAYTVSSACSSSNHAIGQAYSLIKQGEITTAIAGGTEACITFLTMKGWEVLRIMSPDTCRPFSKGRQGLILGEGAGCFILESYSQARKRRAEILAEVIGYGMSAGAHNIMSSTTHGMILALRNALKNSGLNPEDVDYINAYGVGTPDSDVKETQAIQTVFQSHASRLPISSFKSSLGDSIGSSGAMELVGTILALRHGLIPPTLNYLEPDPDCPLDYVPNQPRSGAIRIALSNSFGFGGMNSVIAIKRFDA